jgi:hypothetical protein
MLMTSVIVEMILAFFVAFVAFVVPFIAPEGLHDRSDPFRARTA